jgi:glutamate carboxypeptidase
VRPVGGPVACSAAMTDAIRAAVAGRAEAMVERIVALAAINSHTGNPEGGRKVGAALAGLFGALPGVSVRTITSEKYADHLVIETDAAAPTSAGCVALVGHLDTVFPVGSFETVSRDGDILRGPGVLDMKGGLVVAWQAMHALADQGLLAKLPLRFVIVAEEEIGSPESRPIIQRELAGAACALVFEAGRKEDRIITARKGSGMATVVARGVAAHAANGHAQGVNAIWAMSRFVDRVQAMTDYERGITVNVGTIKGGEAKNTVPDRCEALLDVRFLTTADGEVVLERLRAIGAEVAATIPGASLDVAASLARAPLERTPENLAVFAEYAACAKVAGLGSEEAALIAGGSDASSTAAIGVPSIDGLGPRGSGFHTKEELIEISSLEPKAEALARFLAGRVKTE